MLVDTIKKKYLKGKTLTEQEIKYFAKNKKKKCSMCEKRKLLQDYYCHPTGKYGYHSKCKKCLGKYHKVRITKKKDDIEDLKKENEKLKKKLSK